jgi:hypothetical protein
MIAVEVSLALPEVRQSILTTLEHPWQSLRELHPVAAVILVIIGVGLLLYGFRIYKGLVIAVYACVGVVLGQMLAEAMGFSTLLGMIGGAIVLGVAAWPLYMIGWSLLGGAVFAALGALTAAMFTTSEIGIIAAAGVAAALGIALTILLMRPLIIIVTSVVGATVLVEGALALCLLAPDFGNKILGFVQTRPLAQAILVAVPASIGIILQYLEGGGKGGGKSTAKKKKEPPAEKS